MSKEKQPQMVVVQQESSPFALTKNCAGCLLVLIALPVGAIVVGSVARHASAAGVVTFAIVTIGLLLWATWPRLKPWLDSKKR